ncbi:unnamed protein product [Calicophoron daubneyi]|uniref:EF-hand domain-containing protein n=1 Tax=Calicophoron daubneyi TaxID=300641 RepID=A0AAV2TRM5_CALDB
MQSLGKYAGSAMNFLKSDEAKKIIQLMDTDHDGHVTMEDVKNFFSSQNSPLNKDKIMEIFKNHGKEKEGKMSVDELADAVTK